MLLIHILILTHYVTNCIPYTIRPDASQTIEFELFVPRTASSSRTSTTSHSLLDQAGCVALHLVLHYFLLTNYAWMLCEGFYLHTVLVSAFISEQRLVRWLMAFGWIAPGVILIVYGFLRGFVGRPEDTIQWVYIKCARSEYCNNIVQEENLILYMWMWCVTDLTKMNGMWVNVTTQI